MEFFKRRLAALLEGEVELANNQSVCNPASVGEESQLPLAEGDGELFIVILSLFYNSSSVLFSNDFRYSSSLYGFTCMKQPFAQEYVSKAL